MISARSRPTPSTGRASYRFGALSSDSPNTLVNVRFMPAKDAPAVSSAVEEAERDLFVRASAVSRRDVVPYVPGSWISTVRCSNPLNPLRRKIMPTTAKAATAAKAAAKKAGPAKKTSSKARATTRVANPTKMSPKGMAEELLVQTDLAAMDARDQWSKVTAEVDHRRQKVERAVRELMTGGSDASRSLLAGVREAVEEMREAVDKASRTLR